MGTGTLDDEKVKFKLYDGRAENWPVFHDNFRSFLRSSDKTFALSLVLFPCSNMTV